MSQSSTSSVMGVACMNAGLKKAPFTQSDVLSEYIAECYRRKHGGTPEAERILDTFANRLAALFADTKSQLEAAKSNQRSTVQPKYSTRGFLTR